MRTLLGGLFDLLLENLTHCDKTGTFIDTVA